MFENLCSGKLIVFGGLSGGLIEDYLEERGAKTEFFSNQFRNKCEDLSLTLLPCQTVIQSLKMRSLCRLKHLLIERSMVS